MKRIVFSLICLIYANSLKADEGMWLLPLLQKLNIDTMHSLGFKLDAEEIYNINNNSLKDAIVIFGGGCTAEIVSNEGLLLTNHHCGYDVIQNHSSLENNYLEDGFWAKSRDEELPNPGLSVRFLIKIEDVTPIILKSLSDTISEDLRDNIIAVRSDSIIVASTKDTHYDAIVGSFFAGNNYYLCVYEKFNDVRLVGTPPSSIGKFGYETDNWMWPRHTGDFSVFRVYSSADGKPSEYNKSNVPLKPRHFFPISIKDKKIDDPAMVIGYPGSTDRYMTSFEVKELMEISNPNRIKIRGLRLDILGKDMRADKKVNIQYASKYSSSSNYWKYSIGQNAGLKRLNIEDKKTKQESEFTNWVNSDEKRIVKYGEALNLIKRAVEQRAIYEHVLQYTYECFLISSEAIAFANRAASLHSVLARNPENTSLIKSMADLLKERGDEFFKEYNASTDMKVLSAMLDLYKNNVPEEYHPYIYKTIRKKYKNDFSLFTRYLFEKSIFVDQTRFNNFINNPALKVLEEDPAFQTALSVMEIYRQVYYPSVESDMNAARGYRLFVAGLLEMYPEKVFYPDANSTMRLTYGSIRDYYGRDAVQYNYYTTLKGVMEKEDTSNWEFIVPQKLKDLYANRDYGEYGINGEMPVCFITNNDITGGNSGSPVIDEEGNLIGIAFDGNWEGMSSDIAYEPELQRCICVDIRYVLFIIDKYAGASHLIKEMNIKR